MPDRYIASVDAGTMGAKCCVFNLEGEMLAKAYREFEFKYPQIGWVEQDLDALTKRTFDACRKAIQSSDLNPDNIVSIGFSTQRSGLVPVDSEGNQIRNFIVWQDTRGEEEREEMKEKISPAEYYNINIVRMDMTTPIISKLLWLRKHEPENFEKADAFCQLQDYLLKKFGADDYYIDLNSAGYFGFFDVGKRAYSDKILNIFDIPREKLPNPSKADTRAGEISHEVSKKTGFAEGTPIFVGGGDASCSLLGSGGYKEGIATIIIGAGGGALSVSSEPTKDRKNGLITNPHLGTDMFINEGVAASAASSYRWFRDTFGDIEKKMSDLLDEDTYNFLNKQAAQSEAGANGLIFLPYLNAAATPRYNSRARGGYLGLTSAHKKSDVIRATMEGISMEIKDMIEAQKSAGISFEKYRLQGGASKSEMWNQINADILGKVVELVSTPEATALGAAVMSGIGAGCFKNIEEATEKAVHVTSRFTPNKDNHKLYGKIYDTYTTAYESLSEGGAFDKISELQNG